MRPPSYGLAVQTDAPPHSPLALAAAIASPVEPTAVTASTGASAGSRARRMSGVMPVSTAGANAPPPSGPPQRSRAPAPTASATSSAAASPAPTGARAPATSTTRSSNPSWMLRATHARLAAPRVRPPPEKAALATPRADRALGGAARPAAAREGGVAHPARGPPPRGVGGDERPAAAALVDRDGHAGDAERGGGEPALLRARHERLVQSLGLEHHAG